MAQITNKVSKQTFAGELSGCAGLVTSPETQITPRQQEVLDLLVDFVNAHGYPPTCQELANLLGVASPNAALTHLRALERKGVITLVPGTSRGIRINGRKEPAMAVQLLRELLNNEPGARARAIEYLKISGGSQ